MTVDDFRAPFRLPAVGDIVTVPSQHIYLGTEDLRLRVMELGDGKTPIHPSLEWVTVAGQALHPDGTPRGYRSALVRLAALYMPTDDDE